MRQQTGAVLCSNPKLLVEVIVALALRGMEKKTWAHTIVASRVSAGGASGITTTAMGKDMYTMICNTMLALNHPLTASKGLEIGFKL